MYVCMYVLGREREREMRSQARPQDTLAFFLMPLNLRHRFTYHLLDIVTTFFIFSILSASLLRIQYFQHSGQ